MPRPWRPEVSRVPTRRASLTLASAGTALCLVAAANVGTAVAQPTTPALPEVGQCFKMTKSQMYANSWSSGVQAVDCAAPHTIEVVATASVPASVAAGGWKSPDVQAWLSSQCHVDVNRYAGLRSPTEAPPYSRTLTYFWLPTQAEWKGGDRRTVCAAGSVKPQFSSKGDFTPTPTRGSIRSGVGDSLFYFAKRDGTKEKRTLFAVKSLYSPSVKRFPGTQAVARKANSFCRARAGATWTYTVTTEADWKKGFRWINCWYLF